MTDTLATLQRLRRLEADQARRALAEALGAERDADSAAAAQAAALRRETAYATEHAARDFAEWFPCAQAARRAAAETQRQAAATVDARRETLAATRAAERAVTHVREARIAQAKLQASRKQ